MKIAPIPHLLQFEITDTPGLDPIRVFIQDLGPGQGRLTIECYGQAWSNYWSAMGSNLLDFVANGEVEYLANALDRSGSRRKKHEWEYLQRIVSAVRKAVRLLLSVERDPFTHCTGNAIALIPTISDDAAPKIVEAFKDYAAKWK